MRDLFSDSGDVGDGHDVNLEELWHIAMRRSVKVRKW